MKSIAQTETVSVLSLLKQMKRIRMVELAIAERYKEWKMRCPTHLCVGQEAVSAGVGEVLRKDDLAVSAHRAHGHYLAKGGDLKAMLAEIYGKVTGCCRGKGGSMHLIDQSVGFKGSTAIVGGTIPVGVGLGLSIELKGGDQVSCVFLGEAAVEEGVFYESVNFAVLANLPVLFICENNLYSVYSPLKPRQPEGRQIHRMVREFGCHSEHGDGNNVVEVWEKVSAAVDRIRAGEGPQFLEFSTYRWLEHCGPNYDNDLGYRTEGEFRSWKEKDPIASCQSTLLSQGVIDLGHIEELESDIEKEIQEAFAFAEASPFPEESEAFSDLYKE